MCNSKTYSRSARLRVHMARRTHELTVRYGSVWMKRVKWLAVVLVACVLVVAPSCTTLVNRRDLYSPEPSPDSLEAARQWYGVTTASTATNQAEKTPDRIAAPDLPKGRFAFTRATSVLSTRAVLPSRRLRFALLLDSRCRRDERDLKTFPRAVILKRLATDLRVLLRAMDFGIRPES
jgi:hypothetical protein